MTADQEQTERGASTVDRVQATSDRLYKAEFFGRLYLAVYVADVQTLCADLERVTAERDAMRVALLKIEEIASRPSIADEERMSMVWQIVVLSLDATRKATADATEQPARAEGEGMSETLTVAPSASCDRQTHGGGRDFCATHQPGAGFWPCKESLETALVEARAVIAAVGMLHYPSRTGKWCRGCETLWPCDTHRALSAKRP